MPSIMFAGKDAFLAEFEAERVLCFHGRLGSGKSLMAHAIAEYFLQRGYRLITNMSSAWADDPDDVRPLSNGQMKAVIILDEGGLYVRSFKTVQAISSFARKLDTYLIFSGKKLPHSDLQGLTISEWFNFEKHFLIPVKIYKWVVESSAGKKYSGYVWCSGFKALYGLYSTFDPGGYPGEIVKWFEGWTVRFFERFGRSYQLHDVATGQEGGEQEIASEFRDAAREFERAFSLGSGKAKKRR